MNTKQYMDILEAKILETKGQLSSEAQRFIDNDFNGDLFIGPMAYQSIIEQRYFMDGSDDQDWNILENILNLIDLLYDICEDYEDENEDDIIEIDED